MASYTPIADLVTILKTIDATNLTNYATRPLVLREEEEFSADGSGALATGIIRVPIPISTEHAISYDWHHERHFFPDVSIFMEKMTAEGDSEEMIAEIKRVFRVANQAGNRSYLYEISDLRDFSTKTRGHIECDMILTKEFVSSAS